MDQAVAELASRQHGVLSRGQLRELGVDSGAVGRRIGAGRLHVLHPGVYSVGHRSVTGEGRWIAAVLRAAPGAVLSHRSAAALWDLRKDDPPRVEITLPHKSRSGAAIKRHRTKLGADEITLRRGIPVTTVSRTLLDLAVISSEAVLMRAIREAEVLRLPLRPPLKELLERHRGRRGIVSLRSCLQALELLPSGLTRSALEDRFLSLLAMAGLPAPETNAAVMVGGIWMEVDCCWHDQRVIVELDGHEVHGTRAAFEADRGRERRLQAAGWTVVRVTWRQLHEEQGEVAHDLRRLLA